VGRLTYEDGSARVEPDTIYDLASLTKVIATSTLAMRAVAAGLLSVDTRLSSVLEGWRGADRDGVIVRNLLEHSSGLPAVRWLYGAGAGREVFEREICSMTLEYMPGTSSVYSDLGFMLLGFVLEDVSGASLASGFESFIGSLGGLELSYGVPSHAIDRTAPTQEDEWRGRLLRGEVDDRNAFALGGVSGHSGLFGSSGAVGGFARAVLRALDGANAEAFGGQALVRSFTERCGVPGSTRALGWDTMAPSSSCGTMMSRRAFGHTGFTGTSLWIDPESQLYFVLLSNRVYPRATDAGAITQVRRAFHDALLQD
jgi:CubicO group peptidase (beta-lactamase class C family)